MAEPGRVGWAILGCGRVAERRVAPVIAAAQDARLAAVCSRSRSHAEHFAERHAAEKAHDSVDALLADENVDIVYIATPHALHAEQAVRCLSAGKHVLVEKPMATDAAGARAMSDAARANNRLLGVMLQQRFHAANMHLIRLIDEGQLGRLNMIRIHVGMWLPPDDNWRVSPDLSGGGAAMDLGPHVVDLMIELAGKVRRVTAHTNNLRFKIPVEDFCSARLEFESGAVGLLDVGYCFHDYGGRLEAYGSEATYFANGSMQSAGLYQTWFRRGDVQGTMHEDTSNNCYAAAVEDFTDAVLHNGEPSIGAEEGIRTARVIEAIYESAGTGRTVELD